MARVKGGVTTRSRKKKVFRRAKGFRMAKSKLYRQTSEAVDRALQYAYRDRRARKRDFRSLWIIRINAAARLQGLSYNQFINGLKKANVEINRQVLADLAVKDIVAFTELARIAKEKILSANSNTN
jgi:large subunit ribosomal protein L20